MSDTTDFRRLLVIGESIHGASYPAWVTNPPMPTLTTLVPASIVVNTPTMVTVTGTNFTPGSKVWADEERQTTTYVSATTLRYNAVADAVGSQTITVHNGGTATSAGTELTVTATQEEAEASAYDPGQHTVDDVLDHADAFPDEVQALYDAESNGKGRVTLLDGLRERGAT